MGEPIRKETDRPHLVYNSLEDFLIDRHMIRVIKPKYTDDGKISPDYSEEEEKQMVLSVRSDRDYTRTEERRLLSLCEKFAIKIYLFQKDDGKYCITEEVWKLFSFMLDEFYTRDKKYEKIIKKPSEQSLMDLRDALKEALKSVLNFKHISKADDSNAEKVSEEDDALIMDQISAFEKATGCPHSLYYSSYSPLTKAAIEYMKEDISLSDDEWTQFTDVLEYDYRYKWRVLFINYSQKELKEFLGKIGKSDLYPDEIGDIREFFMRHTEKE